jgi:hypothetical protein
MPDLITIILKMRFIFFIIQQVLLQRGTSFHSFFVKTYNFVCMDDVIYEPESALCNINKHYLQLS